VNQLELLAMLRVLAKQAKTQYRELLVYRAFAQYLNLRGYQGVDELLEDARNSQEVESAAVAYAQAIDFKIPPSGGEPLDGALKKWLANLPTTDLPN